MKNKGSFYPSQTDLSKNWVLFDASNQILGRLASDVAAILKGKHKATYSPSVDMGDFVVIINCDKIKVTGNKLEDKSYYKHSGFPGGLKETVLKDRLKKDSSEVIRDAVKGMLPGNRLGRSMINKLKVYSGAEHPHEAQEPVKLEVLN